MKKIIAPLIITVLVVAFIFTYGLGIMSVLFSQVSIGISIIVGSIFIFLLYVAIYTFIKRYQEIKEEDEDDISKY